jgi:hypothetical protein
MCGISVVAKVAALEAKNLTLSEEKAEVTGAGIY